jgi:ADP-ribosylation factor-like protein 6
MSGQGKYRSLWEKHYPGVEAIIFVVDAADELRFGVAQNELEDLLANEGKARCINSLDVQKGKVPILFFANKSDLPNAHSKEKIADALGLAEIENHLWQIQNCDALSGKGVNEGIQWLSQTLKTKKK